MHQLHFKGEEESKHFKFLVLIDFQLNNKMAFEMSISITNTERSIYTFFF